VHSEYGPRLAAAATQTALRESERTAAAAAEALARRVAAAEEALAAEVRCQGPF